MWRAKHTNTIKKYQVTSSTASILSPTEKGNILLGSDSSLPINSAVHTEDVQDLQDFENNKPYQDNNALEAEMPLEEHKEAFLPELGDGRFGAENEVSLILCRINEAANSTTKAIPYPPSVEYANASPWEAKDSGEKPHHDGALFLSSNLQTNCPSFPDSY